MLRSYVLPGLVFCLIFDAGVIIIALFLASRRFLDGDAAHAFLGTAVLHFFLALGSAWCILLFT